MKKKLAFTVALMMTAMAFSGCGGSDSSSDSDDVKSSAQSSQTSESEDDSKPSESQSELKAPVNDGAVDIAQGLYGKYADPLCS